MINEVHRQLISLYLLVSLLLTANVLWGKLLKFSQLFSQLQSFPLNHLLLTMHNGLGMMHRKSFSVNSVFCAQPQKLSPLKKFAMYGILCIALTYNEPSKYKSILFVVFLE